jgi:hypothetical protein
VHELDPHQCRWVNRWFSRLSCRLFSQFELNLQRAVPVTVPCHCPVMQVSPPTKSQHSTDPLPDARKLRRARGLFPRRPSALTSAARRRRPCAPSCQHETGPAATHLWRTQISFGTAQSGLERGLDDLFSGCALPPFSKLQENLPATAQ